MGNAFTHGVHAMHALLFSQRLEGSGHGEGGEQP